LKVRDVVYRLKRFLRTFHVLHSWILWLYTTALGRTPILLTLVLMSFVSIFSTLFSHIDHLDAFNAIYWIVITITTVGYGDIVPHTIWGKVLAMLVAVTGFSTLTVALSLAAHNVVSKAILEREGGGKVRGSSVLIVGTSPTCVEIAERLKRLRGKGSRIVWVTAPDVSEKYIINARTLGIMIIKGNLTHLDTYLRADVLKCDKIIICGNSDKENVATALVLKSVEGRRLYPPTIISLSYTSQGEKILTELVGVDMVVPSRLIGTLFMESFSDPTAAMFLSALSEGHPNLLEIKLIEGPLGMIFARTGNRLTIVGKKGNITAKRVSRVVSRVQGTRVYVVARFKNIMEIEPLKPCDYLDPNDILVAVEFKSSIT
jgi:voltage-gated potassium channel